MSVSEDKICSANIINSIGAGICLVDRNFQIIRANNNYAKWFGSPRQIQGKNCYSIFEHRQHICRGCPALKVFKTGQIYRARKIGFSKDGKKHYYQLTVSPIKDSQKQVKFALELIQEISSTIVKKQDSSETINKLKRMYRHLSLINEKLCLHLKRLKDMIGNLSAHKYTLERKYRRKVNKLLALKQELRDIFKINRTLSSGLDLKKIYSLITRYTCELMRTDACVLRLIDGSRNTLVVNSGHCISDAFIKKIPILREGEGISCRVLKTKKPLAVYDVDKDSRIKHKELIRKEGFKSILSVPVMFNNKILGVISTYSKKARHFSRDETEVLSIFAYQIAMAVQESRHYEDIHISYFNAMHALVLALEVRDPYTRGHTERVTKYALDIARALHLSGNELEILRYAGEVHDVGKISIPDFILNKPGKLTTAERAVIQLHPIKGAEMLEPLDFLKSALPIVRHHHEKYDGTGYPDGLAKEDIPLMARIMACADAFDAMTSERPYRSRSLTVEEAIQELKAKAGTQFDPFISHLFIKIIRTQPHLKKPH